MIKIYGNTRTRANRCLWLLEEIGRDYEHISFAFGSGENQSDHYLKLNPSGKVPTMEDDGLVLFESIAINLYLAKTYGNKDIWPADEKSQALVLQWSFWAVAELEPPVVTMAIEKVFKPEPARNLEKATQAEDVVRQNLPILEQALATGSGALVRERFCVADLNVASILSALNLCQFDFGPWPSVKAWLNESLSRPAYVAASGR